MRDKKIISILCAALIALTVASGELPRLMSGSAFISAEENAVIGESGEDFDSVSNMDEELEAVAYSAADTYTSGDYEYTVTDGKATITRYNGSAEILEIPGVIDGYHVTMISGAAFDDCTNITSITIPDSVTEIGYRAFEYCTSLVSVKISESMTEIPDSAFWGCASLTSITIPDSVTWIASHAFDGCTSLTSVTIPNSVTRIGAGAFCNCTSLTRITIPNSVTSIGSSAFSYCESLTSITLPNSINSISAFCFYYCSNLTDIVIPNNVTLIDSSAFCCCENLISITLPDSLNSIGWHAFGGCTSLTSITIPDSVNLIGDVAFQSCKSLTSITIPQGVTSIGEEAFSNCTSLENITIADSVTEIGSRAFHNCTSLTSITLPDSVTSIDSEAFLQCESLTSVTMPNNMTEIGWGVFEYCTSLASLTIPQGVTSIDAVFYGCRNLTSVTIPDSVTEIGDRAFYYCTSLASLTIPQSVTSIDKEAFDACTNLTIYGYAGSYAETYANENDIPFVDINNQDLVGENTVIEDGQIPDLMNKSIFFYKNPITYQDVTNDYFTIEVDFVNKNVYLGVQNYYLENDSIAEIVSMEDVDKYGYTTTILTLKKKNNGKTNLIYTLNDHIVDKCEIDFTVPTIIVSATKACSDHLLATKAIFNNYGYINDVVGGEGSVSCILSDASVYKASDIEWTISDESIIKRNEFSIISENSGLTFEYVACKEGFAVITASLPNGSFINFPMHIRGKKCNIEFLNSGAVFSTYDELPYQSTNLKLELCNDVSSVTNDSAIVNYCTAHIQGIEVTIPEGFSFDGAKEVREYKSDNFGSKSFIAWGEKIYLDIPLYTTIKPAEEEKLKKSYNFETIVTIEYQKYIITGEISLRRFDTAVTPEEDEIYDEVPPSSQAKNKVTNTFERYYRGYLTGNGSSQSTIRTGFYELKNYISGAWFNKIVADTEMFCTFEMMGISSDGDYDLGKIFGYDGLKASSMLNLGKKTLLKFDNVSVNPKFYKTSKTITVYIEVSNTGGSIGESSASMCTVNAYIPIGSNGMHCGRGAVTYSNISSLNDELKKIYKNTVHANGNAEDFEYWIKMGISEYLGVTNINMGSAGDIAKLIDKLYKSVSKQNLSPFTLNSVGSINKLFKTTYNVSSGKQKLLSIFCPVDVEVFDSENNLIGEIRDNVVLLTTDKATMTVEGDVKKCGVDLTDEYIIRLTGTDNGTMDYVVDEMIDGEIIRTVKINALLLISTKTYYGNVDEMIFQTAESYALIDNDGSYHDVSEDNYLFDSEDLGNVVITIPENVSVHRDNEKIIDREIVQAGDKLVISPVEMPGYQINSLKVNGQSIHGNEVYTVRNEDIVITVEYSAMTDDHIHTFSTEWKSDSASHWHECACGEKIDLSAHTENSGVIITVPTTTATGVKTYSCTVCGYVTKTETVDKLEPEHTHSFSAEWKSDGTSHWHECACGEKVDLSAHTLGEWIANAAAGYRHRDCTVCGAVLETESLTGGNPSVERPVTNPTVSTGTTNTENTGDSIDPADPKDEDTEESEPDETDEKGDIDADTGENDDDDEEDEEDEEDEDNELEDDGYDDTFSKDDTDGNDAVEDSPIVTPEAITRDKNPNTGVPVNAAMILGFLMAGATAYAAFSKRKKHVNQ